MISLELLIEEPCDRPRLSDLNLGVVADERLVSDRLPSLWQEKIINRYGGMLVHLFDRTFSRSDGVRWLYEDVVSEDWRRFAFKSELEGDFIELISRCAKCSRNGSVWVMSDAQYGPKDKLLVPKTFSQFLSFYRRYGLRLNSAVRVHA